MYWWNQIHRAGDSGRPGRLGRLAAFVAGRIPLTHPGRLVRGAECHESPDGDLNALLCGENDEYFEDCETATHLRRSRVLLSGRPSGWMPNSS